MFCSLRRGRTGLVREARRELARVNAHRLPRVQCRVEREGLTLRVCVGLLRKVALPLVTLIHGRDALGVHAVRGVREREDIFHLRRILRQAQTQRRE